MKIKNVIFASFSVFLFTLLFLTASLNTAHAAANPLRGYAWSEGVGWISFSSVDTGLGSYGVNIDSVTGDLSGNAWSDNVGTLSFDRSTTGNPPSADIGNGSGAIARLDSTTHQIIGWARFNLACKKSDDTTNCITNGAGASDISGGWTGWVQLNGNIAGNSYGITLNPATGSLKGFAWGTNTVVGWIYTEATCAGCVDAGVPVISLQINSFVADASNPNARLVLPSGNDFNVSWSTINAGNIVPNSCNGSTNGPGEGGLDSQPSDGSYQVYNSSISEGTEYYYQITCQLNDGSSVSSPIGRVIVLPPNTEEPNNTCTVPANMTLCSNSSLGDRGNGVGLYSYGDATCRTTTATCQFQCISSAYKVANGMCVKKSIIIEQ